LLESAVDRLAVAAGAGSMSTSTSSNSLLYVGGGVSAVGLVVAGVGAFLAADNYGTLENASTPRASKDVALGAYPFTLGTSIAGGAIAAAGIGIIAFSLAGGES
jgi:hypothetical protein